MKLYTMAGACSMAPHIALQWSGLPFEAELVKHSDIKSESYLKINPAGSVPALVLDDGDVILQNVAILQFVSESSPDANLMGTTPRERAETMRWLSHLNSDVHKSFLPIFGPGQFAEDDAGKEFASNNAKEKLNKLFGAIDKHLEGKEWLANGRRSIADPYLFVVLRWAGGKGVDLSGMKNLEKFMEHMGNDIGVKAVMKAEGLS
ncbi:MAG: glutathione S-transferase N-terminal domain-containing protein [Dokdonella sp.]